MTTRPHAEDGPIVVAADDVWKSYDQGTITVLNGLDFAARK